MRWGILAQRSPCTGSGGGLSILWASDPPIEQVVVHRITHSTQPYAWGSDSAIPELLGLVRNGAPVAEAWWGAHPGGPSRVVDAGERTLADVVADDPAGVLGVDVVGRFGAQLPYLLKVIAAARPLSLQVHPHIDRAREGYAEEDAAGVPVDAP